MLLCLQFAFLSVRAYIHLPKLDSQLRYFSHWNQFSPLDFYKEVTVKTIVSIMLMCILLGCGPDRALISDTKFDMGLRKKMEEVANAEQPVDLLVQGKCSAEINGLMREGLIDAGANVQMMKGDVFKARVSSDSVFDVAGLEFVVQLELLKE